MNERKLNIALLAGGDSSERVVSVKSAAEVAASMDKDKYNIYLVDILGPVWKYTDVNGVECHVDKNDFSIKTADGHILFDYALIIIHGTPGEDGKIQGYFEMMGVPYSTGNVVSSALTFDKAACKKVVSGVGVNLAKERLINRNESIDPEQLAEELGLPMFIKPNASGSSFGVTKVTSTDDIIPAIEKALCESDQVLVEEFIEGREIACGILITEAKEYIFPVTEIISKKEFFDFQAKYEPGFSDEITPAQIDAQTLSQLNAMTREAYLACNCRGVVRVDFIVKQNGTPVMIEINSVPGMSNGSIVPQQAACCGMTLGDLFDIVIKDTYFERR